MSANGECECEWGSGRVGGLGNGWGEVRWMHAAGEGGRWALGGWVGSKRTFLFFPRSDNGEDEMADGDGGRAGQFEWDSSSQLLFRVVNEVWDPVGCRSGRKARAGRS